MQEKHRNVSVFDILTILENNTAKMPIFLLLFPVIILFIVLTILSITYNLQMW